MSSSNARDVALLSLSLLAACDGSNEGTGGGVEVGAGGQGGAPTTSSGGGGADGGGQQGGGPVVGGAGGGVVDPCADALLCEKFDDYAGVTTLTDDQLFGPWRAALNAPGATMSLDGAHTVSGASALHMRIESGETAGGRLFADGDQPLFQGQPTQLYGRMMMYIDPNGSSVHWTFFGASGDAEPGSPEAGRRATYLISSLPRDGVNTYSFVYGLSASDPDPYHDCWFQSEEPMPTAAWTCVAFELDSVSRELRLTKDGAALPIASVDDHGQGCVGDVVPDDAPWYGPAVDQIYVGAWSFHPMEAPLEVWIDDLVVDTSPVPCPP